MNTIAMLMVAGFFGFPAILSAELGKAMRSLTLLLGLVAYLIVYRSSRLEVTETTSPETRSVEHE